MIDHGHALLPIAMDCLHYQENERPSSEELCQRLAGLKEAMEYRESVQQVKWLQIDRDELERQIGEMQVRESANTNEIQRQREEIQSKDVQYQQQERHLLGKIESQQRQLQQLNQQLEEQEQVTAEIQQTNHSLQRQVEQLQQQLTQQNTKPSLPPTPVPLQGQVGGRQLQQDHSMKLKQSQPSLQQVRLQKNTHPPTGQMVLGEWRDAGRAPSDVASGDAVVDGNIIYFMSYNGKTYSYNPTSKRENKFRLIPDCPRAYGSLAVVKCILTAIGGCKDVFYPDPDNKLLSILNNEDKKWVEHYPPMPTKRYCTAAVTTKQHLIVAGGQTGTSNNLNTVEVMDIETLVWSTAASLPHPYSSASATICGDHLYMLGGWDSGGNKTKSVLTCSLTKLLQSCSETLSDPVWCGITDVPVYHSTCAAVNGELVAVGGMNEINTSTAGVYKYNPTTNSWNLISIMPTARCDCLVAVSYTHLTLPTIYSV